MEFILLQAFIYLGAAVAAVPIARRLGLGSVLGYLVAGAVIGPFLGLVGAETQDLQHYAEFGVVMMLFIVGLELEPRMLWELRHKLLGLGGLQISITAAIITLLVWLVGQSFGQSVVIGLILALSSTAIVLQTLTEKGLARSTGGRSAFAVLLMQDIAVIPMLAVIPLLAVSGSSVSPKVADGIPHETSSAVALVEQLPGWASPLVILAAVAVVILGGQYLTRPVFRFISRAKMREIFVAAALLMIVGIALLMTLVGLSPALGTFLAGVVLANSEYRHELESDIEPFKGLLLGLFFITVGAGIDFELLLGDTAKVLGLTAALMSVKLLVLLGLGFAFGLQRRESWLFALSLAQAGEFGFVLTSFALQSHVLDGETANLILLVVALSMFLTPALFIIYERGIQSGEQHKQSDEPDLITPSGPVIIAGMGRFGQMVNRFLAMNGHETVVLDESAERIERMRKLGVRGYFGNPTRLDLLEAAGLRSAVAVVVAISDTDAAVKIIKEIKRLHPSVYVIARAHGRMETYQLYAAGADEIVRELFDSSVRAGKYALIKLGHHPFEVERLTREFIKTDRSMLRELAEFWDLDKSIFDNKPLMEKAREQNERINRQLRGEDEPLDERSERAWSPPPPGSSGWG